jgi:hypothetical protein
MQVNNITVVDRNNRPNIGQKVGLRAFFLNDGAYSNPYEISGVSIFKRSANLSPSSILDNTTLLVSATPLMHFAASGETLTSHSNFNESGYSSNTTASGIYKLSDGEYAVVLDNSLALSGIFEGTEVAASSCSAVDSYLDVWTVKHTAASKYQIIIHEFNLYNDTFTSLTEPLLFSVSNKLTNKHIRYGEKIDLRVGTEIGIENKSVPESTKNIFKDSLVTSAAVQISKVNENQSLAGSFTVSAFSDTSSTVDITADDTIVFNWDTSKLTTLSAFSAGTFGSLTGTYSVQVQYTVLNQKIISPLFYVKVT